METTEGKAQFQSRGRSDAAGTSRSRGRTKRPLLIRKEAALAAAQEAEEGGKPAPSRSRSKSPFLMRKDKAPLPQDGSKGMKKSGSHGSLTKILRDTVDYLPPRASKKVEREPLAARSKDRLLISENGLKAPTGDWMTNKAASTAAQRRLEKNIRTRELEAKASDYDKTRRNSLESRKSAECISGVCTIHLN